MWDTLESAVRVIGGTLLGGGFMAWLNRRKNAAETKKLEAEADNLDAETNLKHTQAKHTHFEEMDQVIASLSEQLQAMDSRLKNAEAEIKSTKAELANCEARERRISKRMQEIEISHMALSKLVKLYWPVEVEIPAVLDEVLCAIDAKVAATSHNPKSRRNRRLK